MVIVSLFFATLVSEDLTCIAAGLLIQRGEIGALPAVLACAVGILAGDVGLWAAGRVCGRTALKWQWVARHLPNDQSDRLRGWLTRHAAGAIVGSRFLPGTRLPLYVIAGFVRLPASTFLLWASIGTVLWTPPLVLFSATLDGALRSSLAVPLSGPAALASGPAALALGFGLWTLGQRSLRRLVRKGTACTFNRVTAYQIRPKA